jgi:hypothetical protein
MTSFCDIAVVTVSPGDTDPLVIMSLAGACQLSALRDEAGRRREFPCRAINMSSQALMLATPARATLGDGATAYIPSFGKLSGRVSRVMAGGFVMTLMLPAAQRRRIAIRLAWLQEHQAHDTRDLRRHARIVPRDPFGRIAYADGTCLSCLVLDMSVTGAALSADRVPEIGAVVTVGRVPARVCRHFPEGFAVAFLEELAAGSLERLLLGA